MRWCLCAPSLFLLASLLSGQPPAAKDGLTPDEKKFLDLTNQERIKQKLPPLRYSPVLSKVGRAHAENMAKQAKMAHVLDGKDQFDRIKGAGYRYRFAGENVARGTLTMEEMIAGLMKSKGHRANILKPEYTELGIGLARGGKGPDDNDIIYYAQEFASPRPPADPDDDK
jgi:uncharacterized protein YkwD